MALRLGLIILGVILVLGGIYFARQSRTEDDPGLGFAAMAFLLIGVVLALYGIVNPPHAAKLRPALAQQASSLPNSK
jgi:drug/metabolite transporter (DMT)-like permease